ncbi:2'-5' RNA ligase family protein [Legionella sp. D16C41]|uniref:2'-5' RNA ligase family protein n=1 Tax=Legionella sp. D16C41 TaxID=3402688 RepID=UPI003AF48E96
MTFILTLELDSVLQNFFEQQRRQYYPSNLNKVPAHVSVFHQLPEKHFAKINTKLNEITSTNVCVPVTISGIKFLGRGNAYSLDFDQTLFLQLRKAWDSWLILQDKQTWQPHVTIQNKVSIEEAKLLNQALYTQNAPLWGSIIGLNLWRYLDGPWEFVKMYQFQL